MGDQSEYVNQIAAILTEDVGLVSNLVLLWLGCRAICGALGLNAALLCLVISFAAVVLSFSFRLRFETRVQRTGTIALMFLLVVASFVVGVSAVVSGSRRSNPNSMVLFLNVLSHSFIALRLLACSTGFPVEAGLLLQPVGQAVRATIL